jgi:hypothetical protein
VGLLLLSQELIPGRPIGENQELVDPTDLIQRIGDLVARVEIPGSSEVGIPVDQS